MRSRLPRTATTFYVTISGLGGEPDYEQRFKMWADDIDGSLKKAGGDAKVITLQNADARAGARRSSREISQAGQARPTRWCVMLIGHGTYRRRRVQVQHSRVPTSPAAELAGAAGPRAGAAAVGGEHDQLRAAGRSSCCASRTAS